MAAFRGTQVGTTVDYIDDMWVDVCMWELPDKCVPDLPKGDLFDNATVDYFSEAVEYTLKDIVWEQDWQL